MAYAAIALSGLRGKWKSPALAVWFILVVNQFAFYNYLPRLQGPSGTLAWARTHLASDPPRYAMLAEWDRGHEIRYVARIPPVADNFGTQSSHLREAAFFFTTRDEAALQGIFQENRIRWVLASFPLSTMEIYQALSGSERFVVPSGGMQWRKALFQGLFFSGGYDLSPEYYRLLPSRLFLFDGMEPEEKGRPAEGLERFRLIYESAVTTVPFDAPLPAEKLFEYVPGAKARFRGAPGDTVRIGLVVETNTGRTFRYRRSVVLGPQGEGELILPYSTLGNPNPAMALDRYLVESRGRAWGFDVAEEEVLAGSVLDLDLPTK